ncbi:MAG: DUF4234 domain-containing protein [Agitococcus sp.]|nr:DUF4234 domain-containing protein [Agitococcus sp.]
MSTIAVLKDAIVCKTLMMALLTVATAGLYPLLWLYRHYRTIDEVTQVKTASDTLVIWIAVCIGIGGVLMHSGDDASAGFGLLVSLVANILYIVWAFKAKAALEEYALREFKVDLRMNAFYTFVLNVFYINFTINSLPDALRRQQILTGGQPS